MIYQKASNLFNAAVYIRLSREDGDKEESDSVGNQRKLLTEYVNKHDDFILYDVYIDDVITRTNFDRPDFHKMIADIENNNVNLYLHDILQHKVSKKISTKIPIIQKAVLSRVFHKLLLSIN